MLLNTPAKLRLNSVVLILLVLAQSIHLILEIRKDIFICRENCTQLQLAQRFSTSNIQGTISDFIFFMLVLLVLHVIRNYKNDVLSKLIKNDVIIFVIILCGSFLVAQLNHLHMGSALMSLTYLPFTCILFIVIYFVKLKRRKG